MALIASHGFLRSTIGKKYLMGLAGIVWTGFVLVHMVGNLLIFVSPDAYNAYGHAITSGNIIYIAEAVLILALVIHIGLAFSLTMQNRAARPGVYAKKAKGRKSVTLASQTMGIQGSLILTFIVLHIATFKYGTFYRTTVNGVVIRDLYKLMVEVFQQPGYVAWYLVSLIILGFHLSHGVGSVFQSFGWMNGRYQAKLKIISYLYAGIVALGFISQPVYIFLFAGKG
ncbi:MAG: succinate dehydrogenase cytochrome b subunit [Pseudobdellovibrionaceae bacterium]